MMNWSYDEGSIRWQSEMTSCHGVALFTEKVYDITVFLRAWEMLRSDSLSSTSVNKIPVHVYGLRWVFEKTAYMHILVNNNFIESMEWNTASHCQPNLSTYIVDCFESVSSLYSQLIVHLPVPLTGRIHAVRDCMYYMSDFLHYVKKNLWYSTILTVPF